MVPLSHVVHKANSLAFAGFRQNQAWFSWRKWNAAEDVQQFTDVVPITLPDGKAKGCKLFVERLELADIFGRSGDLEAVSVDDGDEIVEPIMRGGHAGFPVGSFGKLTITKKSEDSEVLAILLAGQGRPTAKASP